ncbi:MAG TPA: radical SAM family heme chaperone HemW [Bacteroidales bacterium]|nr:radical SAM family heme chaperone HemW [Bacteroidales bacterium]
MAGIYVHIPFCRKICSYCDFYKSTLVTLIPDYLTAINKELEQRKNYLHDPVAETVYFGGGTPTLLKPSEIQDLIEKINSDYKLAEVYEITLEANPDDLKPEYLQALYNDTSVNRLSIGIQSFNDDDLKRLNRRHNSKQALESVKNARMAGFRNISIDLIYGIPQTNSWKRNLEILPEVEHISAYHLTIEPGTLLSRQQSKGLISVIDENESTDQFNMLREEADKRGLIHYEISNLAKPGYFSRHNTNYWKQKEYLGLGPSAHSFDLDSRQWNISNLQQYIQALNNGENYSEKEILGEEEKFNEYVMLSLRTLWGADAVKIERDFGVEKKDHFLNRIKRWLHTGHIFQEENFFRMTPSGWLISDYIMSSLMHA